MAHSASSPSGYCTRIISTPITADTDSADQHVGAFAEVAGAERLCREPAGAHADERAVPVDEVEDRHADGQRADRGRESAPQCPATSRAAETMPIRGTVMFETILGSAMQYFAVHGHNGCKDKVKVANLQSGFAFILIRARNVLLSPKLALSLPPTLY